MKRKFTIIYAAILLAVILLFVFFPDMDDLLIIMLATFLFILTSAFTYSGRKK